MNLNQIGVAIRQARVARGITQKELAESCGLSRATVNAMESGKAGELGFGKVGALAARFGMDIELRPAGRPAADAPARRSKLIESLARRYIWWKIPGAEPDLDRIVAQIMELGSYDDVKALEAEVGRMKMRQVLAEARPGWFSPRSWDFWHVALGVSNIGNIPPAAGRTNALPSEFPDAAAKPAARLDPSRPA